MGRWPIGRWPGHRARLCFAGRPPPASMSGVMSPRPNLGSKPHLGYTQSLINRAAERRLDTAWLGACLKEPRSQTYVIGGEMIVLKKRDSLHDPSFTPDEARALAPSTEMVFLGLLDGAARVGTGISQADAG